MISQLVVGLNVPSRGERCKMTDMMKTSRVYQMRGWLKDTSTFGLYYDFH